MDGGTADLRAGERGRVSLHFRKGNCTLSGITTSLTMFFDGTMAYCARSADPIASGICT